MKYYRPKSCGDLPKSVTVNVLSAIIATDLLISSELLGDSFLAHGAVGAGGRQLRRGGRHQLPRQRHRAHAAVRRSETVRGTLRDY